jgi:hypothetical protein
MMMMMMMRLPWSISEERPINVDEYNTCEGYIIYSNSIYSYIYE